MPGLISGVFLLKQALLRPRAMQFYASLLRHEGDTEEATREWNWKRRRDLLGVAYRDVPFYRARFDAIGLRPEDIRLPEQWGQVPILRREDLRGSGESLCSVAVARRRMRSMTTGGSTGKPVEIFYDSRTPYEAIVWRMLGWWGLRPGMHAAHCWRLRRRGWLSKSLNSMIWWPTRRIWMDAADMNEASVREFLQRFDRLRPALLQGYVGAVHHVARVVLEERLEVHSPLAIWVTSAPLAPSVRMVIERAFRAPVYDQYGCCEVGYIAAECECREGLHVFSDVCHVEVVDQGGRLVPAGDSGDILLTDLENGAFPLIRYRNGDTGTLLARSCSCGRPFPLLGPVRGRVTDIVVLPGGGVISGEFLTTIFDHCPNAVESFQVHQCRDRSIVLRVVANPGHEDARDVIDGVRDSLVRMTSGLVDVSVELRKEIGADRGKTRYVTSDVQRSADPGE